jgi:hypothetical protein
MKNINDFEVIKKERNVYGEIVPSVRLAFSY